MLFILNIMSISHAINIRSNVKMVQLQNSFASLSTPKNVFESNIRVGVIYIYIKNKCQVKLNLKGEIWWSKTSDQSKSKGMKGIEDHLIAQSELWIKTQISIEPFLKWKLWSFKGRFYITYGILNIQKELLF